MFQFPIKLSASLPPFITFDINPHGYLGLWVLFQWEMVKIRGGLWMIWMLALTPFATGEKSKRKKERVWSVSHSGVGGVVYRYLQMLIFFFLSPRDHHHTPFHDFMLSSVLTSHPPLILYSPTMCESLLLSLPLSLSL